MGASTDDDATPRFEARVDPVAPVEGPRVTPKRVVVAAITVAAALAYPYAFGAPIVLPLLFVWLGLRIGAKPRPRRGYTVRFFDDVLELSGDDHVGRTPWEHVSEVKQGESGATISMPGGRHVEIPVAQLPAEGSLREVLPPHVRLEVAAPPPPKKNQRAKTFALWLVLVVLFYAVYQVMGSR